MSTKETDKLRALRNSGLSRYKVRRELMLSEKAFSRLEKRALIEDGFDSYEMSAIPRRKVASWLHLDTERYRFDEVKEKLLPFLCEHDLSRVAGVGRKSKNEIIYWVANKCENKKEFLDSLPNSDANKKKRRVDEIKRRLKKMEIDSQKLKLEMKELQEETYEKEKDQIENIKRKLNLKLSTEPN